MILSGRSSVVERLVTLRGRSSSIPFARSNTDTYMTDLSNKKCVPCEGGVIPFDISEIRKYQKKVDGWNINENKEKIFFRKKF